MSRNLILGAALGAVLLTVGVVVGRATVPAAPPSIPRTPAAEPPVAELPTTRFDEQAVRKQPGEPARRLKPVKVMDLLGQVVPSIGAARKRANETAAIATLRNITSAQAQFQASGLLDQDQDGVGEYAGFIEMSGGAAGRMSRALHPPVLSRIFRELNAHGEVTRSGYHYRLYLPDSTGAGV